jgi:hypothetical protein
LAVLRDGEEKNITAELDEAPAGEHNAPQAQGDSGEEMIGLCHQNAQRIEQLERKISRLEKRLADLTKNRSVNPAP